MTFFGVGGFLSLGLTAFFYPGVRRQASNARDSLLASAMAALLCATSAALVASFLVNAAAQLFGPSP
jgi:hypothetical protein